RRFSSTTVWQNGGFSAKFNGSSSIELLCKTEHLCFDFRHFAKLQTVSGKAMTTQPDRQIGFFLIFCILVIA
ncbi:hypothetical protein, partial [Epilithonimonas hominis]|uniref:hypothetical protein n=1 Tax=Epilithonimonas hominis TaxID=420404 RepID=UPI001C836165